MYTEAKAKKLCRVLALIDAEQSAAKGDAKAHKERIDELLEDAHELRIDLASEQEGLFPEGEPEASMAALAAAPAVDEGILELPVEESAETSEPSPGIDGYQQGADARLAGKPVTDNPYSEGSYHGVSWDNGWNEFDALSDEAAGS